MSTRGRRRFGVRVGMLAAAVAVGEGWRLGVPSLWTDEAATVGSATRDWNSFLTEIRQIDAVHAVYYVLVRAWFIPFGHSAVSLRALSVLSVCLTCILVAFIGRRWFGDRGGLVAAAVFALIPQVTHSAVEGRSTALVMMLVAASSLALLRALEARSASRWIAYAALVSVGVDVNVFSALTLPAHLALVMAGGRSQFVRWLTAAAAALLLALPVVVLSAQQTGQIAWIRASGTAMLRAFLLEQTSPGNGPMAVILTLLALCGAVLLLVRRSGRPARSSVAVALLWLAAGPGLLLIGVSFLKPMYVSRYAAFGAIGVALLCAAALNRVGPRTWIAAALTILVAISGPSWAQQRTVLAKGSQDWAAVASQVASDRSTSGRTVVVFGPLGRHQDGYSRRIEKGYPDAFAGTMNLTAGPPQDAKDVIWGGWTRPDDRWHAVSLRDRVILVGTASDHHWDEAFLRGLSTRGFIQVRERTITGTEVSVWEVR